MNHSEKPKPYRPDNYHNRELTEGVNAMLHHYAGVYGITCSVNGKRYIGSSKDIQNRWWTHRYVLRKSKNHCLLLQNAWNKYGEDAFVFEVLEHVDNLDDLIVREQYYLDTLKPEYNLRTIAEKNTGITWSPESVEKTAAKNRGKKRPADAIERTRLALTGRVYSEETLQRMKASHANMSLETRSKMSKAKQGISPISATEAAAKANKGKPRPQAVIDKIRATRLLTWERQKAQGYHPAQDDKGKFI